MNQHATLSVITICATAFAITAMWRDTRNTEAIAKMPIECHQVAPAPAPGASQPNT